MCNHEKFIMSLLVKNRQSNVPETSASVQTHHPRLPNMKLPNLSGQFAEYKTFMSLFENLVHNDLILTDIKKFNNLISYLSETTLVTVKPFRPPRRTIPKKF